jgi:hypothetical protein
MANIDKTIRCLKEIINDPNCKYMNLSNVKGYLGELLVLKKLEREGKKIRQKGNQSGYDLELVGENVRIDVKFSNYKGEIRKFPKYWGWALKHGNKKKGITCTHFVCVAANENLEAKEFYVIKKEHLKKFPKSEMKQFKRVVNGFVLLPEYKYPEHTDKNLKGYFEKCRALVSCKIASKVLPNDRLIDYLK